MHKHVYYVTLLQMHWKIIPNPHFAPYMMGNTTVLKYTQACPVVIEDKLILIGGKNIFV